MSVRRWSPLRLALRSLRRYPLRAAFMAAGVTMGIGALTVLNSIGEGTKRETLQRFKNMIGTFDTVILRPGAGKSRGMVSLTNVPPTLKFEDAEALSTFVPAVKQVALVQDAFDVDVRFQDRSGSPAIFGVSANWLELRGDEVLEGRFITREQEGSLARVAVLGTDARLALFGAEDPLGKTIRIGDVPFQVQGLLRSRGAGPAGGSLDDIVLIPVTTASRRLFNRDFLTMVIAQLRDPRDSKKAVADITALLRERHHLATAAFDDFTVTNPQAVMAQVSRLGSTLETTLEGIAVIATLVGGIVIMALMLTAVSERARGIGICRSVGATQADVLLQFLLEAVLAAALGGASGLIVGWAATSVAARLGRLPGLTFWGRSDAWSLLLSVGLGAAFGIYPAWRAARVHPATALKA